MSHKYLDIVRALNKIKTEQCYICKDRAIGIIADKHRIHFVCKTHYKLEEQIRESTQDSVES
jgi:hypothetical protein